MDRLSELAAFARVVETGGFSAAARRLELAPSVVSKLVGKLERSLGAQLLTRTTRKLHVTGIGARVYEHCVRIVEAAEQIGADVAELSGKPKGRLKLSAPAPFGMLHLARAVTRFIQKHPGVEVDMTLTDHVAVELVQEGYDLALRILSDAAQHVIARRLAPINWVLCGAPDYLRRRGTPKRVEDLAEHNCLIYPELLQAGAWRLRVGGAEKTVKVRGNCRINNSIALHHATVQGLGLAVLPIFVAGPDLRAGRLKPVLPECKVFEESALYAVYLPHRHVAAKVRAFVDFCAQSFGPSPHWEDNLDLAKLARQR